MPESNNIIIEERGFFWWLGEVVPKSRYVAPFGVPGILTVHEDGRARLNVTESLLKRPFLGMAPKDRVLLDGNPDTFKGKTIAGRIHGQSRCVYLTKIMHRSLGRSVDDKPTEEFYSDLSIVGNNATIRGESSLRFSKVSVSLDGLEDWRRSEVLVANEEAKEGAHRSRKVTYTETPIDYSLKDGTLSLRSIVHCTAVDGFPYRELSMRQYDFLDYHRKRALSIEGMQQEFTYIEQFLALLTGTYYSLDWPQVSIEKSGKSESYTLYFLRDMERSRKPEIRNLWTMFPRLQETFGQLYQTWREKRRKYGPGFYLFLGALRSREMYVEHRFANLVWGIESLHRGMNAPQSVSKGHRKRIDSILMKGGIKLNSDERKWLKSQRKKPLEVSLEQRIFSTFLELPWKITESSLRKFSEKCAARRNDVSHFGGPRTRKEDYGVFMRELIELTAGLTPLYHAALLQEIGIKEELLLDCASLPIGFSIRRDLELARLSADNFKAPDPQNMELLRKEQQKHLRKWRRARARAQKRASSRH